MMVELTLVDGTPIYIATHRVIAVWAEGLENSTILLSDRLSYRVQGTPRDVVAALHPTKTDPMLLAQQESGA
jgi:hypothetical protein